MSKRDRPDDRKWHRSNRYEPRHHKRMILNLRRLVKLLTQEQILSYLNYEHKLPKCIYVYGDMAKIRRIIHSIHGLLIKRLMRLRYYL